MRDLYRPVMVTVKIGPALTEYTIPRALICGHSAYFDGAFSERFKEGQEKVLALPDVAQGPFEVFVDWLYTQRVYWDGRDREMYPKPTESGDADGKVGKDKEKYGPSNSARRDGGDGRVAPAKADSKKTSETSAERAARNTDGADTALEGKVEAQPKARNELRDQASSEDHDHSNEGGDAVTWPWHDLFELFIFANKYDTRRFRNALVELVQIKALQCRPKTYTWPSARNLCFAFDNLPATSTLYRFLSDMITWELEPENAQQYAGLPQQVLATAWFQAKQRLAWRMCGKCAKRRDVFADTCARATCGTCSGRRKKVECGAAHAEQSGRPPYERDICLYHEHETAEESALCKKRWELIKVERDIGEVDFVDEDGDTDDSE
ncbi:hypothetical protein LTR85_006935 [Meristemomyces frigidus]|nr:hypothetical protein LTR85_006935 [Meristemomyces frigidus]